MSPGETEFVPNMVVWRSVVEYVVPLCWQLSIGDFFLNWEGMGWSPDSDAEENAVQQEAGFSGVLIGDPA